MDINPAWYETWFDTPFYHTLYQDRNIAEAEFFLQNLIKSLPISKHHSIMDIACGRGRHALYLAAQGFDVTGIDLSPNSISFAQHQAQERGLNSSFYVHDMRKAAHKPVDVVLNLFTSIGYFENTHDNTKAIQAFYNNLNPGGVAVIDFLHAPWVKKHWVSKETVTKGGIVFALQRKFEDGWIQKNISFDHKGKPHTFTEKVRALELTDFQQICQEVGFTINKIFGDYKLTPFNTETAERLILVLQK